MKQFRPHSFIYFIGLMMLSFSSNAIQLGEQSDSLKSKKIIYVEILQPILFGKAGLGLGFQKPRIEYLAYANYIFTKGLLSETPFYNTSERQWTQSVKSINGFEVGAQFRFTFKTRTQQSTYAQYIKSKGNIEYSKRQPFYLGPWAELSLKSHKENFSFDIWESKFGGLLGWRMGNKKVFFDTNIGIGWGTAWGKIKYPYRDEPYYLRSRLLCYKLSVKLGIKL